MTTLSRSVQFLRSIIDRGSTKPIIVGISGPQGSGKSYLAENLLVQLRELYRELNIIQFLMDDLYLTHDDQLQVTSTAVDIYDDNKLLQGRGLPGTHELTLAVDIFEKLKHHQPVDIPIYDKSCFSGEGDRSGYKKVDKPVDVVIFEGWFNGFQPLSEDVLKLRYLTADFDVSTLPKHKMYHLQQVNENLRSYQQIWQLFDYFIYIKSSVLNVYEWRIQQEHALKKAKGVGMTDEKVIEFVNRYMPVYELYYEKMTEHGCAAEGSNLELEIDIKRNLVNSTVR